MDNVSSKAMLAELRISRWTARKLDKKAAAQVAQSNAVQSSAGRYYKSLIEGDALRSINKVADEARAYHYRTTLPWSDTGPRVLSARAYFDYMGEMQNFSHRFDAAVTELVNDYPRYRQEAVRLLGALFNPDDYPDPSDIVHLFGMRVRVTPLPMANDFRVELGAETTDNIRAEIEAQTQAAVQDSMKEAYARVRKVAEAFIDRLSGSKTIFRDSLVENARDLAEVLPALNFTGDPALDALATELADKLGKHEPETLRQDPVARRETCEAARDIDKKLASLFGGAA